MGKPKAKTQRTAYVWYDTVVLSYLMSLWTCQYRQKNQTPWYHVEWGLFIHSYFHWDWKKWWGNEKPGVAIRPYKYLVNGEDKTKCREEVDVTLSNSFFFKILNRLNWWPHWEIHICFLIFLIHLSSFRDILGPSLRWSPLWWVTHVQQNTCSFHWMNHLFTIWDNKYPTWRLLTAVQLILII